MNSDRPVPIFTPEQIDVLHTAFATVCRKLQLKAGDRAVEDIAVKIVDLAAAGICDIEGLTRGTGRVPPVGATLRKKWKL